MKKIFPITLLLIAAVFIASCRQGGPGSITKNLIAYNWHIAHFSKDVGPDNGKYAGYTIKFQAGDSVTALQKGRTYKGSWEIYAGDTTDDTPPATELMINFEEKGLSGLNGQWMVVEYSVTEILLNRRGRGNTTDYLTLARI